MRLKNLTIKGFKSFANETSLNFNDDVIGVVGPNGSGKSNVVDAIRWVLGEQKSRELRLDKMSDVIFNGTKNRKQAGMAQVTLTFDNDKGLLPTEYQSVSISRLLYRTGESEYRLNGVTCRLKDITSLLIDTGIGSNSYAIIALGMVDDILADKENARRRMFEQAAGISKYKKRKHETLNKLKSTSADLDRVEDLLFEIENNLKSLEKQAKRARKYLEIKAKHKELSIQFAQLSLQSLKEEYKSLGAALKSEQDKYRELDVLVNQKEAQLESEKKTHVEKEHALTDKQKKLNEVNNAIRNKESDKSLQEQKVGFKSQNIQVLQQSVHSGKKELEGLNQNVDEFKKRIEAEKIKAGALSKEVEKLHQAYQEVKSQQVDAKKVFDERSQMKNRVRQQVYGLEKDIAVLNNKIENEKAAIQRQVDGFESKKSSFEQIKKDVESLNAEIENKNLKIDQLTADEHKRDQMVEELSQKIDYQKQIIADTHRSIDAKQNEYDLLKSMVDNFEGFPESIKFLSSNWKKEAPILSDQLDVEEGYKGAIEQFLEPYLNYFVVDDLSIAQSAIKLLTDAQKGKANFFLLDQIKDQTIEEALYPDLIPAAKLVRTDSKFQPLIRQLLYKVYVTERQANMPMLNGNDDITIIAANGQFIRGKNFASGGSIGLFEGKKIGRKKSLEKLNQLLSSLGDKKNTQEEQLLAQQSKLSRLKQEHKKDVIQKLNAEKRDLEQQLVKLNLQLDNFKKEESELKSKKEYAESQISNLLHKLQETEVSLNDQRKKLEEMDELDKQSGDLDALTETMTLASQQYNSANITFIQHQNLLLNIEKDYEFKRSKIADLEKKIQQENIKIQNEDREIKDLKNSLADLEKSLISDYEQKAQMEGDLSEAEQKYYAARTGINELEDEIRKINRNQNQIQLKVQQVRDAYTDVKFKINGVGERLKIEFGIQINDVINAEVEIEEDADTLGQKVEKLKLRIQNYGEVNPMAVEAYEEMKERYDTISSQRDDILEAKSSLLKTIQEIETSATKLFLEAFDKIRANFIEVFRSLFSEEDNCNLILLDEANPLESPIEIIAKPKGKKPKSLSQLSGGEKTLTATALLFALYLLKPAPFCIFDEVDAPLDDANIQKFNKIIKKFSDDSQFIIVTHNKSTMAAVDILYGVYMQEQGVSAVTPVDFRTFDDSQAFQNLG